MKTKREKSDRKCETRGKGTMTLRQARQSEGRRYIILAACSNSIHRGHALGDGPLLRSGRGGVGVEA